MDGKQNILMLYYLIIFKIFTILIKIFNSYLGISIIYQGTEQDSTGNPTGVNPYYREELWPSTYSQQSPSYQFIAKINAFRSILPRSYFISLSIEAWIDNNIYAFLKIKHL